MKKLVALALLALMLLAGCTAEGGPDEGSSAGAESPVAEASSGDAAGEDRDFARRAYAAQRADGLLAFTAGQEDLVRLTEWVFAGYEEFGPDTAVLLTHEAFPDSLDNNRVWQESGRLEQFLENLAAGTPDSLWYGDTGEPMPLLLYKLEFDGETLTRHFYPDPELPEGLLSEEAVPLTWEETGAAVLLREEDGEIWLVWPRYGFERFVPTEEEIAAAAGGAMTEQTVQNGDRGEAVLLTADGFELYLSPDGSAAYGVE